MKLNQLKYFFTLAVYVLALCQFAQAKSVDTWQDLLWAQGHTELIQTNQRYFKRLKKKFESGQIIGLELIIAAKTSAKLESRFGHAMLRFVDKTIAAGDDITLSFVADVTTSKLSYTGGIFGKYPLMPLLKPFRLFNRQYVKLEGRPLERHIIPTDSKMRTALWLKLQEWFAEIKNLTPNALEKSHKNAIKKLNKLARKAIGKKYYKIELKNKNGELTSIGALATNPIGLSPEKINALLFKEATRRALKSLAKNKKRDANSLLTFIGPTAFLLKDYSVSDEGLSLPTIDPQTLEILNFVKIKYTPEIPIENQYTILANTLITPLQISLGPVAVKTSQMGSYTFLNNNCTLALIHFLKAAKFPYRRGILFAGRIPVKLPLFLERSLLNPYPVSSISNLANLKAKLELLKPKEISVSTYLKNPRNTQSLLNQTSNIEKWLLIDAFSLTDELEEALTEALYTVHSIQTYDQVYGITKLDPKIYELCATKACAENLKIALKRTWPENSLFKRKRVLKQLKKRYKGLHKNQNIRDHLNLIFTL